MKDFLNKIFNRKDTELTPSFWYMRDNMTFIPIKGKNIIEIKNKFIQAAKENPYGMVCPVNILKNDKEIRRIGPHCHVDRFGNIDHGALEKWEEEIMKENCIRKLKK